MICNHTAIPNFCLSLHTNFGSMLQKTFGIYADDLDGCSFFVEAGSKHFACWCSDAVSGAVKAFELFQFDTDDKHTISDILRETRLQSNLMDMATGPVTITWNLESALCIPQAFYREDLAGQYLDAMLGTTLTGNKTLAEYTPGGQVIITRQPAHYIDALHQHFTGITFTHKFCALLKKYVGSAGEDTQAAAYVYVIFYPSYFILTAINNNALQIIRCINYSTAEDALYNIMQVCSVYNMPLSTTAVVASGLIDTASNLYNILYSYIDNFEVAKQDTTVFDAPGFHDHPTHYFLPFI